MSLPITVSDSFGRLVTFHDYPERIVSLAPGHTEILFRLGLAERVVGVTEYCDFPAEARAKERIGGFATPDLDKILSLRPQLVLATGLHQKVVEELSGRGVPVLALDPRRVSQVSEVIRLVGQVTGVDEVADQVAVAMEEKVGWIRARVSGKTGPHPRVYFACPYPSLTAGPGSIIHDLITLAGGDNVAGDREGNYVDFPIHLVRQRDPEIILFAYGEVVREHLLGSPEWAEITAVKEGRLFLLDKGLVNHPGPRLADGLEQVARAIRPEAFVIGAESTPRE